MGEVEGKLPEEVMDWLRGRPVAARALMIEWPPMAVVTVKEGEGPFMVPAPGIEGTVQSYTEGGLLGVVAPVQLWNVIEKEHLFPHRKGQIKAGDPMASHLDPEVLELVRFGEAPNGVALTSDLMKEIFDGSA